MQAINTADTRSFRRALGNFATGIAVVTATSPEGITAGMTINSFNSVSLEPPLVLWSIDKKAGSLAVFGQASHFAVNILSAQQVGLSNHFARPGDDKFASVAHQVVEGGALMLTDCAAVFLCKTWQQVDGGDHWIMIGEVTAYEDNGYAPLLYHQGSYSLVMPLNNAARQDGQEQSTLPDNSQLASNLYYLMTQAVSRYHELYQPLQLASGLRTAEARTLLVMADVADMSAEQMRQQINMPDAEVSNAIAVLLERQLLSHEDEYYQLTAAGKREAATLWEIAGRQQDKMFADFSGDEIAVFRKILNSLINAA
ncbi:MAG: flavin reductase [Thiolinea sp.]